MRNTVTGNILRMLVPLLFLTHVSWGQQVALPFGSLEEQRITGSVSQIRTDAYEGRLIDRNWKTFLDVDGFGMFGVSNLRGDDYVIMVDGLIRNGATSVTSYTNMLNVEEIEDITILKDASSRLLYGAYADKGIIMIRTKRGKSGKNFVNVDWQTEIGTPVSYPGYLSSADYMILYNEARKNDGLQPKYSFSEIEEARSGKDPVKYPDQNYYRGDFLRSFKPQHRLSADFSGGNKVAQYFLSAGWYNTQSLMDYGQASDQSTNRFNIRGNVDVKLTDYLKVSLDASAIFNSYKGVNWADVNFWKLSTSERVNAYPMLIPISSINESCRTIIDEAAAQRSVIGGKYLLGGNTEFVQNVYGDLLLGGYSNTMDRMAQINVGIDLNMDFLTKGLAFKTYFGSDNYNCYTITQNNTYAVYSPTFLSDGTIEVKQLGVNDFVGSQKISGVQFYRRLGWSNVLSYDRTFKDRHSISAVATSVIHDYKQSGAAYADRSANFGLRANYMLDRRYVVEYNAACVGTSRLAKSERWGYAQSFGAAWIISENDFMKNAKWLDYLKLKASFAMVKTDIDPALDSYYLYRDTYASGGNFAYGDGAGSNGQMVITKGNEGLSWIKKHDLNVGIEAMAFNRSLRFEANWYRTYRFDEPVRLLQTLPSYIGGTQFVPYQNFGSSLTNGLEFSLGWTRTWGDFTAGLRADVIWYSPRQLNYDELDYGEGMEYYQRSGKPTDAIWGLVADGLYAQEDIDAIASGTMAKPVWSAVRSGDIRYRDMNSDNVIDELDKTVIGYSHVRMNCELTVDLKWKGLGLWMHFFGQTGGNRMFNDSYWNVYGEMKYPSHITGRWAYDPELGTDTRAGATHPRLTTGANTHNNQASTWWIGSTDMFTIPDMQLSYTWDGFKVKKLKVRGIVLYLRASDVVALGPDVDKIRLNIGSEPQYRTYSMGLKLKF